ncbi:MAG: hypothetical protein HQK56_09665 [Deltaproteobacteria bacterium]|nr:hypothetical protein [Deltaproteobacteria bacterium]
MSEPKQLTRDQIKTFRTLKVIKGGYTDPWAEDLDLDSDFPPIPLMDQIMTIGKNWPRITTWEQEFVEDVRGQLLDGKQLSERQQDILEGIYHNIVG